jgi:hypothetical protein
MYDDDERRWTNPSVWYRLRWSPSWTWPGVFSVDIKTQSQNVSPSRLPSTIRFPRDRSHEQSSSMNQLCGPHRGFMSGTNKWPNHVLTSSRTRISSPLTISREQRPWSVPPKNVTMSSKDLDPHQEPDPTKTIRTSIQWRDSRSRPALCCFWHLFLRCVPVHVVV